MQDVFGLAFKEIELRIKLLSYLYGDLTLGKVKN